MSAPSLHGYHLLSLLGSSHSGQVYRARDEARQRVVALKLLAPRRCSPAGLARLSELVARVHEVPAALPREVHAVVPDPAQPFVVMRYLPGATLADTLRRSGPLPWRDVLRLGRRVAAALSAAHARGLVHGALKPSNIVPDELYFYLLDHGFWALPNPAPDHLAPELLRGAAPTPASDLYALGLTLFEALTGRPAFTGPPDELAQQHLEAEPPAPSSLLHGLPPRADTLLVRLLAKDPRRRPAAASELAGLLDDRPALDDQQTITWSRSERPDLRGPGGETLSLPDLSDPRNLARLRPRRDQDTPDPHATVSFSPDPRQADPTTCTSPPIASPEQQRASRGRSPTDPHATVCLTHTSCAAPPPAHAERPTPGVPRPVPSRSPWPLESRLVALYLGVLAAACLLTASRGALP